ncbi:hypothetical protein JL722_2635 [Aureococcus anophagefferens]|nr:hypothetical protein JL722_2635 [Aureococcus anophagefferens]
MALHRELVWIKAVAFLTCLMSVAWGRYQIAYLVALGLAPSRIGLLRAAGLGAKFVATPLWGAWAAPTRTRRSVCVAVVAVVALLELYRSPAVVASFGWLFALKMARSAANGVGALANALTLRVIERHPGAGYGAQRLWTGVAWGCGSYVVGSCIDAYGYDAIFLWTYAVGGATLLLLARGPAFARAGDSGAPSPRLARRGPLGNLWAYVRGLDRGGDMRPFLLLMCLYGVAMSLVEALLFLQMAREFESTKALMGLVKMLRVATLRLAARLALLACVTKATAPVALPCLQLLHGPCFALAWTAAVSFAADAATPALRATSRSVLYGVRPGAGLGSVLWSALYERCGARTTYLLGAATVAAAGAALLPRLKGAKRADLPVSGGDAPGS